MKPVNNTPKVQIEAWEAKEKLYELVKHLAPAEQIKKLIILGNLFQMKCGDLKIQVKLLNEGFKKSAF